MLEHIDHRSLADPLDLWHFEDGSPGMVHWHPDGYAVYRRLEDAARARIRADGYLEVRTPQILRKAVWETSGHWHHFTGGMFHVAAAEDEAAIKPVSCPGHIQIAARSIRSYRDLPLRLAEFGVVHRDEPGGTLHGLLRLRQFTQDDGHVFCAAEQVEAEVDRFCRGALAFYRAFGLADVEIAIATRPDRRAGSDEEWDRAETLLAAVVERLGRNYHLEPGGGAFYGPKIELSLADHSGRRWQCGTVQVDIGMPQRFGLSYQDAAGHRRAPVMLHRAVYGSLERFLGLLIERHQGMLPLWMAPRQVRLLPVSAAHAPYAAEVEQLLQSTGVRADIDDRDESLKRRVLDASVAKVPLIGIVGDREHESRTVAVRERGARRQLPLDAWALELQERCAAPDFAMAPPA
jgi:threonyl-tRNA synthetase